MKSLTAHSGTLSPSGTHSFVARRGKSERSQSKNKKSTTHEVPIRKSLSAPLLMSNSSYGSGIIESRMNPWTLANKADLMERCGTQSLEMKCLTPFEGVRTLALIPSQDILLYVLHRNRNEQPWMIFPTRTKFRQRETKSLF